MYIVIAGAGMVGSEVVQELLGNKHDVVVIEQDKETCDKLYSKTGVVVIHGSASQIEIIKEAHIEKADLAVAATGNDATNLAFALLAKSYRVPQVIVRMRDPEYENAYQVAGVNAIVRVTDLMVNQMIMEIEKPKVRKITSIGAGKANIFMVSVPKGARVAGRKVHEIAESRRFPDDCNFIAIFNQEKEEFVIPRGQRAIQEGDELFLISAAKDINKAVDFLTAKKMKRTS